MSSPVWDGRRFKPEKRFRRRLWTPTTSGGQMRRFSLKASLDLGKARWLGAGWENWVMSIRLATRADIPSLMVLEGGTPTAAHWSKEQYEAAFSAAAPRRVTLVLEENGLLGFLVGQVV